MRLCAAGRAAQTRCCRPTADLFAGRVLTFRMRDLNRNPLRAVEGGSRLHQGDFKDLIGVRPT
jgi:hypothetical protein